MMETETLEVNGIMYPVKIHYERRRDCRVSMSRTGINIRIPTFLDRSQRSRELTHLREWARDRLKENPEDYKPDVPKAHRDGEILDVGGEYYLLRIESKEKQGSSARMERFTIHLSLSANLSEKERHRQISALVSRCIARRRLPELNKRMELLNARYFKRPLKRISFRHNRSNWGSCSAKGNINISTRLLFAPDDVLDYVCVHELAHLVECNHSKRFWALVEKAVPDYRDKIKWLKENRDKCRF